MDGICMEEMYFTMTSCNHYFRSSFWRR